AHTQPNSLFLLFLGFWAFFHSTFLLWVLPRLSFWNLENLDRYSPLNQSSASPILRSPGVPSGTAISSIRSGLQPTTVSPPVSVASVFINRSLFIRCVILLSIPKMWFGKEPVPHQPHKNS